MEWVEVAGRTLEEATEHALEQLGVAEADAEVVVLAEPKTGLFGRTRGEARVRARVRPVGPRPKRTRRQSDGGAKSSRGGSRQGSRSGGSGGSTAGGGATTAGEGTEERTTATREGGGSSGGSRSSRGRGGRGRGRSGESAGGNGSGNGRGGSGAGEARGESKGGDRARNGSATSKENEMAEGMTLEEQGEVARTFVQGLLDELGLEASIEVAVLDEETVEISANAEDQGTLGILVGPRGSTLVALQDLTRTVVQRHCPSRTDRILVDVAGYRQRRVAALQRFSEQVTAEVIESGSERALEPMSAADRKVVHDAVNQIEGVVTRSEGEDPHRYIVIAPGS